MTWSGTATTKINLKGNTAIPGLIDMHTHMDRAAVSEYYEEIPDVHNIHDLLTWIKHKANEKKAGNWIVFNKFFSTRLKEIRWPTLAELDAVAPEHPVFLNGSFGGMINSVAMKKSGIGQKTIHPGILTDEKTGLLTGMLQSSAFELLIDIPETKISDKERLDALTEMMRRYNKMGFTSVSIGSGSPELLMQYKELKKQNRLTLRICQNMNLPKAGKAPVEYLQETIEGWGIKTGSGDDWIKTGALKTWMDGGILTGTAWLREPWGTVANKIYGIQNPDYKGVLNLGKEDLVKLMMLADKLNWKLAVHIAGGGAVDIYLDAFEYLFGKKSDNKNRFSIVHGNFFDNQAIQRVKESNIYLDMQAAWFFKDADMISKVLGQKRLQTFHPYKSLLKEGIMVNGGSDHMVKIDPDTAINPYNPFVAMASMVTRKTEKESVFFPEEAILREDALRLYTINNAFGLFEENLKGTIEKGKLADIAVLSDNFLTCPENKINRIKVLLTIVGGKVVYSDSSLF
jgi:predicted amidohydrolase YtcJ